MIAEDRGRRAVVSRWRPCGPQLAEVLQHMRRVIGDLRHKAHDVFDGLSNYVLSAGGSATDGPRKAASIMGCLAGVSANTVRDILKRRFDSCEGAGRRETQQAQPLERASVLAGRATAEPPAAKVEIMSDAVETRRSRVLRTLVRSSLRIGVSPRPLGDFTLQCAELLAARADVGDQFHYRHFAAAANTAGAELLRDIVKDTTLGIRGHVPYLAIPSDLEVAMDGVSLVKTKSCQHGLFSMFIMSGTRTNRAGQTQSLALAVSDHGVSIV